MAEQYQAAALRHFASAEALAANGHLDDASYHLGLVGENAIKHAFQDAGMEAFWRTNGTHINNTPMRGHWGHLQAKIEGLAQEIALVSSGRRSVALSTLVANSSITCFAGWSIDIRYADDRYVPVSREDYQSWHNDAIQFLVDFAL